MPASAATGYRIESMVVDVEDNRSGSQYKELREK
jgi:hypothetical protein